jgi:pyruvate formate lyase activating enzyme
MKGMSEESTLEKMLGSRTVPGELYEKLKDGKVRCHACGHRCPIPLGRRGVCQVRFNEDGVLKVPSGYASALQVDPIEKKPFFHVMPGSRAFSFGMLGCDYHCDYCQNWFTSQALRDPDCAEASATLTDLTAGAIVDLAVQNECRVVTSTYNEPLITAEWAAQVFDQAKPRGLLTSFVSNGNATRECLEYLRPRLDAYKVDLKSFNDKTYRKHFGGTLKPVLESLERLKAMGFWVEVVTLVVPGLNDSEEELSAIARFISSLSKEIPWHVTAFHPDYKMENRPGTQPAELNLSYEIGRSAGLDFVYSGNRPGEVGTTENTYCPSCDYLLVERMGFRVKKNLLKTGGACPQCHKSVPGVWEVPGREPNQVKPVLETPLARQALEK